MAMGSIELIIGVLMLASTAYGWYAGRVPPIALVFDVFALIAVIMALRWLVVGAVTALFVITVAAIVDLAQLGFSLMICSMIIVTAVRKGRFPLATLLSVAVLCFGTVSSFLRSGDERDWLGATFGWVFSLGLVWAVALGVHVAVRVENSRLNAAHQNLKQRLALDLHDAVARDLTVIRLLTEAMRREGGGTPEQLASLADTAQEAGQSLREITHYLQMETANFEHNLGVTEALEQGCRELEHLRFPLHVQGEVQGRLAPAIEQAGGDVVREALHNVAKHGDSEKPCEIEVTAVDDRLVLSIRNGVASRTYSPTPSLGLSAMRQRVRSVGGSITSQEEGGGWLCRISLPMAGRLGLRGAQ